VADNVEEWVLKLVDQASGSAAAMAGGLKALDAAQLKTASSALALANAQRSAAALAAKASADPGNAAKAAAAQSSAASLAIKAAKEQARQQAEAAKAAGAAQEQAAAGAANAMQSVAHPIDAATGALAKMGPQGMAAAAALAVLTAAVTATVGTLAALYVKAIDVVQSVGLMTTRFAALAGSARAGQAVTAMVQRLGVELPFATDQLGEWAGALQRAGVEGKNLESATRAIAAAAALNPAGGANAAQETLSKLAQGGKEATDLIKAMADGSRRGTGALREMGITLADLGGKAAVAKMSAGELSAAIEKALQAKGGGALSAMMNTWPSIIGKAREGFASIFEGLTGPVDTFMGAVRSLFGEFNRGGVAINVLKPIATAVFSTLFDWGSRALNAIHKGFLYVMIGALTAYIALRPLLNGLAAFVGSANMLRGVAVVFALMALPFVILAAAALTVVAIFGVVVGAIAAVGAALVYVIGAIAGFVASIGSAFADAYAAATGAGGSIVDGLVAGVMAGAGAFLDAIGGLASSGLAKFKGIFGIASPSKVMLEHGDQNIAGALATGVDRGADKVDASMSRLGGGAKPGAAGGKDGAGGKREYHFHYTGPADQADDFFDKAAMWLLQLEREAAT
jgi:hypothetical protein